jgi:hypothetical protein
VFTPLAAPLLEVSSSSSVSLVHYSFSNAQIPLWVFSITCVLEFMQLWHPPVLQQFRATFLGRMLIGTTFSWWDFPHYAVGCLLGWFWLRQLMAARSNAKKS